MHREEGTLFWSLVCHKNVKKLSLEIRLLLEKKRQLYVLKCGLMFAQNKFRNNVVSYQVKTGKL